MRHFHDSAIIKIGGLHSSKRMAYTNMLHFYSHSGTSEGDKPGRGISLIVKGYGLYVHWPMMWGIERGFGGYLWLNVGILTLARFPKF